MTSSVGSNGRATVPAQHDAVRSGIAVLVKMPVAQAIQVDQKETNASQN